MARDARDLYFRRQTAIRQILLGPDGKLTRNGRIALSAFKLFCFAHRSQQLTSLDAQGRVDPVAIAQRAARREVWDKLMNLLNLDDYTVANISIEED